MDAKLAKTYYSYQGYWKGTSAITKLADAAFCSLGIYIDFQLDAVCGVDEPGATAMHFLAGHGVQFDQKPELIVCVERLQSHIRRFVFFFHKEAADLGPNVPAFDAIVVQHIR